MSKFSALFQQINEGFSWVSDAKGHSFSMEERMINFNVSPKRLPWGGGGVV